MLLIDNYIKFNKYRTIAHVVEVLSPNRIIICFYSRGINNCVNVKVNGHYCDKKIENKLIEVEFKNNYEVEWIKCIEEELSDKQQFIPTCLRVDNDFCII